MATKSFTPLIGSVAEMDNYIKTNWHYFSTPSKGGYSNCTTSLSYKFTMDSRVNVLHNCVGWAWGRWFHMRGITSANSFSRLRGDPIDVWNSRSNVPHYGGSSTTTPKLGALVIWKTSGGSHIGVVEKFNSNSDVYISEDNYKTVGTYGGVRSRNGIWHGNPASRSGCTLKGYIYSDIDYIADDVPEPEYTGTSGKWVIQSQKSYNFTTEARRNNAILFAKYCKSKGLSLNAVSAILGNVEEESLINPAQWESTYPGNVTDTYNTSGKGRGFIQWTPYQGTDPLQTGFTALGYNLIDWRVPEKQIDVIIAEINGTISGEYYKNSSHPDYYESGSTFLTDTGHSVEWLTRTYHWSRIRSADSEKGIKERVTDANKWYGFLLPLWGTLEVPDTDVPQGVIPPETIGDNSCNFDFIKQFTKRKGWFI